MQSSGGLGEGPDRGERPERLVVAVEGQVACTHDRDIDQLHHKPGKVIHDWHHYQAVIQRKPGHSATVRLIAVMPNIVRRLQP